MRSKSLRAERTLEKGLLFPIVSGTDVQRYGRLPRRQVILFPYEVMAEKARLLSFETISTRYPRTAAYLTENKKRLAQREGGKFNDQKWHRFGRSQNLGIQSRIKLCVPRLVEHLHAAWDVSGEFFLDNVDVGGVTLKPAYERQSLAYLLALLNSTLMRWYFPFVSAPFRGGYLSANRQFLSQLPFRPLTIPDNEARRTIGQLVEQRQQAERRLQEANVDRDRGLYRNQAAALDRQLDEIIYGIYDLTPAEIAFVEGDS